MTPRDWSGHFEQLERSVALQLEQLAQLRLAAPAEPTEPLAVPDVTPPAGLGPLLARDRARAVALLTRLELLQSELRQACARTGRALSGARRATRATPAPPSSYVDSYG